MVPKIIEFQGLVDSKNGWEVLIENKADQILIQTKRSVRGNMMIRASGPIDFAPIDI